MREVFLCCQSFCFLFILRGYSWATLLKSSISLLRSQHILWRNAWRPKWIDLHESFVPFIATSHFVCMYVIDLPLNQSQPSSLYSVVGKKLEWEVLTCDRELYVSILCPSPAKVCLRYKWKREKEGRFIYTAFDCIRCLYPFSLFQRRGRKCLTTWVTFSH